MIMNRLAIMKKFNLTYGEYETLEGFLFCDTNEEIAERIFRSERAVKCNCTSLFKKFKVNNRMQLYKKLLLEINIERYFEFLRKSGLQNQRTKARRESPQV